MLLRDGEPRLTELVHQCVFIDFLKESSSQRVEHRQGAANDSFGQEVNPVLAGIHLRVLRVLRFHFPCLLQHDLSNSLTPANQAASAGAVIPALARISHTG